MAISDRLRVVANSLVGGNIVTILARSAIRLNALRQAAIFEAKRNQVYSQTVPYQPPAPLIAGVPVSARLQETYSYTSSPTQHAVESGAILTDHVIVQPIKINLSFEVSNFQDGVAEYALILLEDMWKNRRPLELITEHKKIQDMVLINLQADNSAPVWGKLVFRATFQQIKLVSLETIDYPEEKLRPADTTGGPDTFLSSESATNQGLQQPKDVSGAARLWELFTG